MCLTSKREWWHQLACTAMACRERKMAWGQGRPTLWVSRDRAETWQINPKDLASLPAGLRHSCTWPNAGGDGDETPPGAFLLLLCWLLGVARDAGPGT